MYVAASCARSGLGGLRRPSRAAYSEGRCAHNVDSAPVNAAERLREALADQRGHGVPFDAAWRYAGAHALEGERSRFERRNWALAFGATRDAWGAAYHGDADVAGALRDLRHPGDLVA